MCVDLGMLVSPSIRKFAAGEEKHCQPTVGVATFTMFKDQSRGLPGV